MLVWLDSDRQRTTAGSAKTSQQQLATFKSRQRALRLKSDEEVEFTVLPPICHDSSLKWWSRWKNIVAQEAQSCVKDIDKSGSMPWRSRTWQVMRHMVCWEKGAPRCSPAPSSALISTQGFILILLRFSHVDIVWL